MTVAVNLVTFKFFIVSNSVWKTIENSLVVLNQKKKKKNYFFFFFEKLYIWLINRYLMQYFQKYIYKTNNS